MVSTVILHNCFMFVLAMLTIFGPAYLASGPFAKGLLPLDLPFWTPKKEAKKVPATSDSAGGPAQGRLGSRFARTLRKRALKNPKADTLAPARGQHSTMGQCENSIVCCNFGVGCRGRRPRRPGRADINKPSTVQFCVAVKFPGRIWNPPLQQNKILAPEGSMRRATEKR